MKSLFTGMLLLAFFTGCSTQGAHVVLQSITFKPEAVTIAAGNSVQLVPVFTPSTFDGIAVTWSSSDATLASVSSSGFVYAIKPGTVTVTVKDKNSATSGKCVITIQ